MRLHAYHAATGALYAFEPDKFPKTLSQFWRVDEKGEVSGRKKRMEILKREQQKYLEQKQKKNV